MPGPLNSFESVSPLFANGHRERQFGQTTCWNTSWSICQRFGRDIVRAVTRHLLWLGILLSCVITTPVQADLPDADRALKRGEYEQCIDLAAKAIQDGEYSETWRLLKIRAEMVLGRYSDALSTLDAALKRYPTSIRLRWFGQRVCQHNGQAERADKLLDEIEVLVNQASYRYTDPENRVVLGRYFLHRGADPKQVLEGLFDYVKKQAPFYAEAYIAGGQLALGKHDYQLAADEFEHALKLDQFDPEIHLGLARAYAPSDNDKAEEALRNAMRRNPRHIDSLLFVVDQHVDSEKYQEAEKLLADALKINKRHPRALAYRAVLAHLNNQPQHEKQFREQALASWKDNPEVDHLIGRKLSQKYRFAEGAQYQRRALRRNPDHLPAKMQLSQDLLRLGEEEEGWRLADEVYNRDGYNVVAHNLVTLRENLEKYRSLETDDFVVRMQADEAEIYGHRVLQLLDRAKAELCAKYDVQLTQPVVVEIFHRQQDFAIRTFGLPGGAGFLGVCFGKVITMNSPASQGDSPSNWQSVLWHEFCHVVTLTKTNNKMPRWLSEGISVYEELQTDSTWGQTMTPQYREMILADGLTPVSQLSSAFLRPPSPMHLQFAYFESALVVEYLVEQYGVETLQRILVDLGAGLPINESLRRYTGSLEALDREFVEFARSRAKNLAPAASWEKIDIPSGASAKVVEAWVEKYPDNYWLLSQFAGQLIGEQKWAAAKEPLEKLISLFPDDRSSQNAYTLLARAHAELDELEQEREVLEKLAAVSSDSVPAFLRLMELWSAEENWPQTLKNAERMLAVNPLIRAPHRFLAESAQRTGDDVRAIEALQRLALMDPIDPADVHFRLGSLFHKTGKLDQAKRHLLQALEEAPRYRDAHRLLLKVVSTDDRPVPDSDQDIENADSASEKEKATPADRDINRDTGSRDTGGREPIVRANSRREITEQDALRKSGNQPTPMETAP